MTALSRTLRTSFSPGCITRAKTGLPSTVSLIQHSPVGCSSSVIVSDLPAAGGGGGARLRSLSLKAGEELLDGFVRVESHLDGVRADEGAAEDAPRQLGDVVALERFERRGGDFRARGNLPQGNAAPLARKPQLP